MKASAEYSSVPPPARGLQSFASSSSGWHHWRHRLIILFLVLFALPLEPIVAGQTVSGTRLYVLFSFLPILFVVLAGGAGRLTATDAMIFGFGIWLVITLLYHHGVERGPYAAITMIELVGGYLAGRLLVRSAADYRMFFQAYFVMLCLLLPFAVFEMMTGRPLLSEILSQISRVTPRSTEIRNNVFRSGVSYPHPILWGMVASLMVAQAWLIWSDQTTGRWLRLGVAVACTVTAMSSAPLLGLAIQISLILWGRLTGNRWWLLTILFTISYISIDLLSNRGPVILMIETLTLNAQTAWWRVYIWNFGTQNVIDNPVLGLGLNDWVRPEWLTASVDNFWLLIAMRHGLPAILLLVLGLVLHLWRIIRVRDISESDNKVRIAYLIGFVSLCFVLSTVHAWGAPSVLVMFYFGMGAYLYTGGARATNEAGMVGPPELAGPDRQLRYSRFSPRSRTPENIELSANLIWQGGSGQEIRLKGNNRVSSK
jgi:hypothetical protein